MKSLFLIRGLPGSGKSTLGYQLGIIPIEADQYFERSGKYHFNPAELGDAHAFCQKETDRRLSADSTVVCNTFSTRWELQPYIELSEKHAARLFVIDLFDGGKTDAELAKRNVHQVPIATIFEMRRRWEHDWKNGNPVAPWMR